MVWSSNNDDGSPWGKSKKDKTSSSNGSGKPPPEDDYIGNLQDRLKNLFPNKSPAVGFIELELMNKELLRDLENMLGQLNRVFIIIYQYLLNRLLNQKLQK